MLIKLRQGRENAKEKVGEKRIDIEAVPSKVNQKTIEDDDPDDVVLDPESPMNSASPSGLSQVSANLTAS